VRHLNLFLPAFYCRTVYGNGGRDGRCERVDKDANGEPHHRYSVFRRVVDYYSDDPTGRKSGEDAFDMRKPLRRDKKKQHVRKNGEDFRIDPEDLYHG